MDSVQELRMEEGENCSKLQIRWNSYSKALVEATSKLLTTNQFADVTLACEGQTVKCHRTVLSFFSSYLAQVLERLDSPEPVIHLGNGIKFLHLQAILQFMYTGETEAKQSEMPEFLRVAEELKVRGLSVRAESAGGNEATTVPTGYRGGSDHGARMDDDQQMEPYGESPQNTLTSQVVGREAMPTSVAISFGALASGLNIPYELHQNDQQRSIVSPPPSFGHSDTVIPPTIIVNNEGEDGIPAKKKKKKKTKKAKHVKSAVESTSSKKKRAVRIDKGIKRKVSRGKYGEDMMKALAIVSSGGSVTEAARKYKIPATSLYKYSRNPGGLKRSRLYCFDGCA